MNKEVVFIKQTKCIKVRLTENQLVFLNEKVKKTGISREAYLRKLIEGYVPNEQPSKELHEVIYQLRKIGNNMNQIARIANSTETINQELYKEQTAELSKQILDIRKIVYMSKKLEDGNNSDLVR